MPSSWSPKRERQYQHIKDSELKSGRSSKRAKSIAAATVNKERSATGEAKKSRSSRKSGAKKRASSPKTRRSKSSGRGKRSSGRRRTSR